MNIRHVLVGDELPGSGEKDFEFYPKTSKDLIERYRIVVFFQGRPTHITLRSKTRIVPNLKHIMFPQMLQEVEVPAK